MLSPFSTVTRQNHEIHRQWVALVDDEDLKDSGTQGYLQLSIAIVGPGDKLKVVTKNCVDSQPCGGFSSYKKRFDGVSWSDGIESPPSTLATVWCRYAGLIGRV